MFCPKWTDRNFLVLVTVSILSTSSILSTTAFGKESPFYVPDNTFEKTHRVLYETVVTERVMNNRDRVFITVLVNAAKYEKVSEFKKFSEEALTNPQQQWAERAVEAEQISKIVGGIPLVATKVVGGGFEIYSGVASWKATNSSESLVELLQHYPSEGYDIMHRMMEYVRRERPEHFKIIEKIAADRLNVTMNSVRHELFSGRLKNEYLAGLIDKNGKKVLSRLSEFESRSQEIIKEAAKKFKDDQLSLQEKFNSELASINRDAAMMNMFRQIAQITNQPELARYIYFAGSAVTGMRKALHEFKLGGKKDTWLFTANMLELGMNLVSAMTANDPVLEGLQQIQKQMSQMMNRLDQIEGKIDDLTRLTYAGFRELTDSTNYIGKSVSEIASNLKDFQDRYFVETRRQELGRLESERSNILRETGICVFGKKEILAKCHEYFESLLASKSRTNQQVTPKLKEISLVNNSLSPQVGGDESAFLGQLSSPTGLPSIHDSILGSLHQNFLFAWYQLMDPDKLKSVDTREKPQRSAEKLKVRVSNPSVLQDVLEDYYHFLGNPQLSKDLRLEIKRLSGEAIGLINEVETLVSESIGNKDAVFKLWKKMHDLMTSYQNSIQMLYRNAFDPALLQKARADFSERQIPPCNPAHGSVQLWRPEPAVSGARLDSFVPEIFWKTQVAELGQVESCFRIEEVDHRELPPSSQGLPAGRYYRLSYIIDLFFRDLDGNKNYIESRRYTTNTHHRNPYEVNSFEWFRYYRALWDKTDFTPRDRWTTLDCTTGTCSASFLFTDEPLRRFMSSSQSNLNPKVSQETQEKISIFLHQELIKLVRSLSALWNEGTGTTEEFTRPRILASNPLVKSNELRQRMLEYQKYFYLAKRGFEIGLFHGNDLTQCSHELYSQYHPVLVVGQMANPNQKEDLAEIFQKRMNSLGMTCVARSIHSSLRIQRNLLNIGF